MGGAARRFLLVVGVLLVVLGWGATRYVDAQQAAMASDKTEPLTAWTGEKTKASSWASDRLPGRYVYLAGIVGMAVGAVVTTSILTRR